MIYGELLITYKWLNKGNGDKEARKVAVSIEII